MPYQRSWRKKNTLDRPIGMWNCKHTTYPIILGVSEPTYSPDDLERFRKYSTEAVTIDGATMSRYEWSQQQRRLETAVREQKQIANAAKAAGDDVLRRECQRNINRLTDEYGKVSSLTGLGQQKERMAVAGFRKVKTADELKNIKEYAKIKAAEKEKWLQKGYDAAVRNGDLSALTGFEHYKIKVLLTKLKRS